MKSVAILLTLVFLTGFQAAVLSEAPPQSNSEPNQSILERLQDQFGKVSTQVTDSVNGGLDAIKERASDLVAYTTEMGKKTIGQKLMNRKMLYLLKDAHMYGQNVLSQSKETMMSNYNKLMDMVEEMKKHPVTTALHEEMVNPVLKKVQTVFSWMGEQSLASMTKMLQNAAKEVHVMKFLMDTHSSGKSGR